MTAPSGGDVRLGFLDRGWGTKEAVGGISSPAPPSATTTQAPTPTTTGSGRDTRYHNPACHHYSHNNSRNHSPSHNRRSRSGPCLRRRRRLARSQTPQADSLMLLQTAHASLFSRLSLRVSLSSLALLIAPPVASRAPYPQPHSAASRLQAPVLDSEAEVEGGMGQRSEDVVSSKS